MTNESSTEVVFAILPADGTPISFSEIRDHPFLIDVSPSRIRELLIRLKGAGLATVDYGTGWRRLEPTDAANTDEDVAEKVVNFHGLNVTLADPDPDYSDGEPDDIVVLIDTNDLARGRRIRIRINDAIIYQGSPGVGQEVVKYDRYDGLYIAQGE